MTALASGDEVGAATAVTLTTAVERNLRGLERSAAVIAELTDRLPAAATSGLDRALAAIAAEREDAVSAIEEAATLAPDAVRERLEAAAERAVPPAAPTPPPPPSAPPAAGAR